MRYTVGNTRVSFIIFTIIAVLLEILPVKAIYPYFAEGLAKDRKFYVFLIIIAFIFLVWLLVDLPNVIVCDDHVWVRYFLIYIRFPFTDLYHMRNEKKEIYDAETGGYTVDVTVFYKNGRKLFSLPTNGPGTQQFVFECKQRCLKEHLKG